MSRAANISVYASITHCRPAVDPPRSRSIPGRATFTAVESRLSMKNPSSAATRTIAPVDPGRCPARPGTLAACRIPAAAAPPWTAVMAVTPSVLIGSLAHPVRNTP
jgi:hypothetical protein